MGVLFPVTGKAGIVGNAGIESAGMVSILGFCFFVALVALDRPVLANELEVGNVMVELCHVDSGDALAEDRMFLMTGIAGVHFVCAMISDAGLPALLDGLVTQAAFRRTDLTGELVAFFAVFNFLNPMDERQLPGRDDRVKAAMEVPIRGMAERLDPEDAPQQHHDEDDDFRLHERTVRRVSRCATLARSHVYGQSKHMMVQHVGLGDHAGEHAFQAGTGRGVQKGEVEMAGNRRARDKKERHVYHPGRKQRAEEPHQHPCHGKRRYVNMYQNSVDFLAHIKFAYFRDLDIAVINGPGGGQHPGKFARADGKNFPNILEIEPTAYEKKGNAEADKPGDGGRFVRVADEQQHARFEHDKTGEQDRQTGCKEKQERSPVAPMKEDFRLFEPPNEFGILWFMLRLCRFGR